MKNKKILRVISILAVTTMLMSSFSMTSISAQADSAIQKETTENLTQADLTSDDIDFEEELPVKKESFTSDDGTFRYTTFTNQQVSYAVFDKALTPDVTKFIVPNKVKGVPITTIGGSAFSHMTKLKQVTIGKYVYSIAGKAFKGCTSLNKINLNKVSYFGKESFSGCKALKSLDLTRTWAEIDQMAFYNCKNLKNVKIFDEVSIHSNAFGYYKNGSNNYAKVPNFKLIVSTDDRYGDYAFNKDGIGYCHNNDIDCVYKLKSSHTNKLYLWAGFAGKFKVDNKSLTEWTTSNSKVLNIDSNG
ncbi:MAG: leucine-rich repeat domain-containing protein, partial [Ruminococcus sp.]